LERASLSGPLVLVVGSEDRGPRPGVLSACEERVAISLARGVESLNLAVALGIVLFEGRRRGTLGRP
jgi:tRNA G18 (ribose-2'-O)-methylase SpoU